MNNRQAIKEAIKWGKEIRKRHIFDANFYDEFMRRRDRVQKIDETIGVLEQLVGDLETLNKWRKQTLGEDEWSASEWKQLELFK